jgi:HEAT repeat protein
VTRNRAILLLLAPLALLALLLLNRKPEVVPPVPAPPQVPAAPRPFATQPPRLPPLPDAPRSEQAAFLRSQARTDPKTLERLIQEVGNPSLSPESRALAALILGTLDDPRALQALLNELQVSRDPAWTRVLLHAIGAKKTGEDDDAFDLPPDSPYVYEIAGLHLCIHTDLRDDLARRVVSGFLSDAEIEVRRAAARSVIHSADHADLRSVFVERLREETDDGIRAGCGHALAEWTAGNPDREVVGALLRAASSPDDGALRFRIEEPLRRTSLTSDETRAIAALALEGRPDQQLWSLSVLRGRADPAVEAACLKLTGPTSESKVREYAAETLAGFKTDTAGAALLRLIQDPEWNVRAGAARGLAGRPSARAILEQTASADPDERVKKAAAETLRKLR